MTPEEGWTEGNHAVMLSRGVIRDPLADRRAVTPAELAAELAALPTKTWAYHEAQRSAWLYEHRHDLLAALRAAADAQARIAALEDHDFHQHGCDWAQRHPATPPPAPAPLDVDALLGELAESPLPGARYAYEVVKRRLTEPGSATAPAPAPLDPDMDYERRDAMLAVVRRQYEPES